MLQVHLVVPPRSSNSQVHAAGVHVLHGRRLDDMPGAGARWHYSTRIICIALATRQVYNESIKDLFVEPGRPATTVNKHDVRLDKKGRVYVEGLVECEVSTCVKDPFFLPVVVLGRHL